MEGETERRLTTRPPGRMKGLLVHVAVLALLALAQAVGARDDAAGGAPAQELYERAFAALVKGEYDRAYSLLNDLTTRYPATLYATVAAERKRRLEELGLHRPGRRPADRSGRAGALVFGTLYSTWLGVGTAIVADADSDQALAAGMMIGAPAGLFATHLLTRDTALGPGRTSLVRLGGLWGTWQGYGWMAASAEPSGRSLTAAAMAGGLAGLAGSAALTRYTDMSKGDASLLDYGGGWGTWFGFCASIMAEADGDWPLRHALTGGNLGLAAMTMLSPRIELSPERARLINLRGLAGTFAATGFVGLLSLENAFDGPTAPMGLIMAGGIAGLWTGVLASKRDLEDRPPGPADPRAAAEHGAGPPRGGSLPEWGVCKGCARDLPSAAIRVTLAQFRF